MRWLLYCVPAPLNAALYLAGESNMELVVPSLEFESAFASFYDDFAKNDAENAEYYYEGKSDFPRYVQRLLDEAKGVNLPEGYVFWLVNTDKTILNNCS